MLSMCGLLCSVLRGWRHNQAVMLMARALSQANSSLLVQDVGSGAGAGLSQGGISTFCVGEGEKGLSQLLWCDNNKQAVIVSPRQCVDLQRWTLFLSTTAPELPHRQGSNGTTASRAEEEGEATTITVLLEATYRERDEEVQQEYHVMVEHLSQPYAWKARDVFGVIVTTTPPQLLAMIQAFFNNTLHIDDDFLIKKIITIEVVGEPSSLADPLSIPECVTPGLWGANQGALTQMELARSLSPSGVQGLGGGAPRTPGNSLRPPALWGLLRHQSSGESATSTSTTLHPQSSTDSERHHSSLDPQSSYDSVSDYPTSDTDDLACNVTGLYPRGWAVSGAHVVSGQPLSVRAALSQLHQGQSCSIVTNPLEDLWQQQESKQGRAIDDGCVGRQSIACLNGPSSSSSTQVKSKTLPRVKKSCGHPHSCLPGSVICRGVQPPQPGKREQDLVREAAQYYQRALDAAQTRHEALTRDQSSASDEDYSFSGSRDEGVVTQEPVKYPVRIKSEADLTRATSIIRDNLANIIQNYLFKPAATPESQPLMVRLALDQPTIKLLDAAEGEVMPQLSTSGSSESKEGSSPPPLVLTGQVQPTLAPLHKAANKPTQHQSPKIKTSPSSIPLGSLPSPHQKPEGSTEASHHIAKKEKKSGGRATARGDKRLTKSEEIVLPPFIRESHIDVPITGEEDLTTSSSSFPDHPQRLPHHDHTTTTSSDSREDKQERTTRKVKLEKYTEEKKKDISPADTGTVSKTQEMALTSASVKMAARLQESDTSSESDTISSTDTAFSKRQGVDSPSGPDTASSLALSPTQPSVPSPKMDLIPDIAMIPPTPDTDTDSGPGTVMTAATPDTDTDSTPGTALTSVSPDTDRSPTPSDREVALEETATTPDRDMTGTPDRDITLDTKTLAGTEATVLPTDVSKRGISVGKSVVTQQDNTQDRPSTPPAADLAKKGEAPDMVGTPAGKEEYGARSDVCSPEAVVTIVHDGCISPIMENLSWEGSSPASEGQGEASQRPRCLKDTHKLSTKSSTASESSFESLPYRMLTSQPESLTDDLAAAIAIELTRPPPETERLRAARLELIRQERIHAISLMSTVTRDSEDGQIWAASLEQQPASSPTTENVAQETLESPVLDSGVELGLQESSEYPSKPQPCSPTSPTESAPESGFSSLRETGVEGSGRGARTGVCLSKSKDSLDLTDADRCPGTDTFSDDMETLSSSAGEATLMESGPVSQRASPRNSVGDSHQDTGPVTPPQEPTLEDGRAPRSMDSTSVRSTEDKVSRYLSDDSSEYKMKTSESLSSEDTVVSRPSLDEHMLKPESQGSLEDLLETPEGVARHPTESSAKEEPEKEINESLNGYGSLEDKWEPHYTWPPGPSFMSQSLHLSIADKLRLLSESEEEAHIRKQARGIRSRRALSAATAGATLEPPSSRTQPHLKAEADSSAPPHSTSRSSTTEAKLPKPHRRKSDQQISTATTRSSAPVHSQPSTEPCTSPPLPDHSTGRKTHSSAPIHSQSSEKTHSSAPVHGLVEKSHSSTPVHSQSSLKTHSSAPVHGLVEKSHSSAPVHSQTSEKSLITAPAHSQSGEKSPSSAPVPGQSPTAKTINSMSAPAPQQPSTVKTPSHAPDPSPCPSSNMRTDIGTFAAQAATTSAPTQPTLVHITVHTTAKVPGVSHAPSESATISEGHPVAKTTSDPTPTPVTIAKKESNGHVHITAVPIIASSSSSGTSGTISTTDAHSSTTTTSSKPSRHSSKSGVSDLEDEVFLPPPENYILNGHPIIYCPRVDMASQVTVPSPKTAVGGYEGGDGGEGIYPSPSPLPHIYLPTHITPPTPPSSVPAPSPAVITSSSSSVTATSSSLCSSPPEGTTAPAATPVPEPEASSSLSSTEGVNTSYSSPTGSPPPPPAVASSPAPKAMTTPPLTTTSAAAPPTASQHGPSSQPDHSQKDVVECGEALPKDTPLTGHPPPTPPNASPPLIQQQQTSSITTTALTTATDTKRGRLGKHSRVSQSKEKGKEVKDREGSPSSIDSLDGVDGKPRLQRMPHLERVDTNCSPTNNRSPTPPVHTPSVAKSENSSMAQKTPPQHLPKRNGRSEVVNSTLQDAPVQVSAADPDRILVVTDKTKWCRGPREARRGGSEEAPAKPHTPNLRKYGSEELSRTTSDSQCSSTSKSYLDADLSSVGSFQGAGGSLELLEGSHRGRWPSRTRTSVTPQSQDLARCEQVSLKSEGSLDKFPHFDQVSANQRQIVPRRKGVSVDDSGPGRGEHMHRSMTLPGSLSSPRKDDRKKDKEEKSKKKKKEKEATTGGEKKSAMMSLKGLLRRNKSKEKDAASQEKLSSPSLFRRLERRSKSGSPSPLSDGSSRQPRPGNSPSSSPVDSASHSPVVANGKTRPVISSPVALKQLPPSTTAPLTTTTTTTTSPVPAAAAPSRSSVVSCSDSESAPSSTPASPQRRVPLTRGGSLAGQPSPRLYKHVLTRNISSSQESLDSSILSSAQSSPQSSPHGSPQRCVIPQSASSLSLPAGRELSSPAPVMGTRALRGSTNSFSVTIGFRPRVERRRGQRTVSEGADLNRVSLSPGPRRGGSSEGSRVLTQLGKRSSSMEILVCGKIREHCPESGSSPGGPRTPFSREGSFRLHREISVETLFEVPEGGGGSGGSPEDYRRYLDQVQAARHGSSSSLAEEPYPTSEVVPRPRLRKYSVPQGLHLSGMRETAMSNPNLQRASSPLVRGMTHSSTFSSSPLRRPSAVTATFSPAKRGLCSSAGGSQAGEVGGAPLMRVEEEGPTRRNLDAATDKPPNILVYAANNIEYFVKVQETLSHCINPDRYIIYHLTDELAFKSPWSGSTTLLVVCGDVPAHISTVFIRYLLKGGRVMSVCSDFLNMAVPLFGTVEVQEQAVVSVSYRQWSSVHLLHHQHCFHSSPRNKRFSRNNEVPVKDPATRSAVSVEPTHVEIIDEYGGRHRLDLRVLATDDTWGAPSLLAAKVHGGQGIAVFSQVHLEHDPQSSLPVASEASSQLAGSNTARLEILRELLTSELHLDTSLHPLVTYTPAYFLGRHQLKEELLSKLRPHLVGEELQRSHLTIQFVMPGSAPKQPAEDLLPILTSACPLTFSTVKYFETLNTTSIGRLVIYCEVVSSSMRVVAGNPPLVHGLAVIPTQQTHGQGRSGNVWLSPLGCAMFSIQLHVALSSPLGQHLSFLQHLVAIAVVQAVVTLPGYADIPVRLKWPNDIYLGPELKIGGVVVEATTLGPQVIVNIGCGINLSNSNPTGCLNDAVRQHNQDHNTDLPELEREVFLARVFNALESLILTFQTRGPGAVQHLYYRHWLHSNAVVTVQNEHRQTQSAVVIGIDTYGFLQARLANGETITLQPDGNSFNMMEGLVYSKVK